MAYPGPSTYPGTGTFSGYSSYNFTIISGPSNGFLISGPIVSSTGMRTTIVGPITQYVEPTPFLLAGPSTG